MNMSMTEKIKAGKLFTDMCEGGDAANLLI